MKTRAPCLRRLMVSESLEARLLLAIAEPQPVMRPSYNTGTGFFVAGGQVYDANGLKFQIRGFNHTHWWGNTTNNLAAINEFPKTKANAVRIVMGTGFGGSITAAQRKDIVERYIAKGIVPIVEDHMGTSSDDPASLAAIVDRWLEPGNVAWLKQYERQVILNIANEWGPDSTVWRDSYITAIARLRSAGVKNMLIVDAGSAGINPVTHEPDSGQSVHTLKTWGKAVIDRDPQRNTVLSIHMYGSWRTENRAAEVGTFSAATGRPWDIQTQLAALKASGLPVIVGEFSWQGAANDAVPYQTRRAMEIYHNQTLGWLAWSWNQNSDPKMDMVPGTSWQYTSDASLTDFGKLVINDPQYGLKATSLQASIYQGRIRGTLFNDVNRNGVRDAGEAALGGWTVFRDSNNNGILDASERAATTNSSGAYAFGRLAAGNYTIKVLPPSGGTWQATTPAGGVKAITLAAGQNVIQNFGFSAARTPFLGSPFAIGNGTTIIQAEDFDNGGEGVAYHDRESSNLGGATYRSSGVDIKGVLNDAGSYYVGYTNAGEWLEYSINVVSAGLYNFDFRVASALAGGNFHVAIDGVDVTGTLAAPNTGGWQNWQTLRRANVKLAAGNHVLRSSLDSLGASGAVGNFNYIAISRV